MRCPHFEKVNFEKIKEVKNQETSPDDWFYQHKNLSVLELETPSEDIFNVPEEAIDHVNCLKSQLFSKYSFSTISHMKEDFIKQVSQIKMPKQMNIKRMIASPSYEVKAQAQHSEIVSVLDQDLEQDAILNDEKGSQNEEGQIPCELDNSYYRKNPQILVSKTSMMAHETFEIFNGIVFLGEDQSVPYLCQLQNYIIKISKQEKIKYFIELQKIYVSLDMLQNERGIKLTLKCKNKNEIIKLYFVSSFQRQIFRSVYMNNVKKIKQIKKIKKFQQNEKENHNNLTNFQNYIDEDLSQIFNQKNQLNQFQQIESISSLSMSSYQGDSLVFETERMMFSQVKQTCNTFDILLFKNKSLMSKMQRIFTNSDYDHTAMLLKTSTNELLMLESTSNAGVAIYSFTSLLKIDKSRYFSRVGLRRYKGQKNLKKINKLENFIRKTVGKKYKFDPMYLIKSEANQQKQTYFCSELVAEALQQVGILSNYFPSFKYLPSNSNFNEEHFAAEHLNNQIIDGRYSQTIILE